MHAHTEQIDMSNLNVQSGHRAHVTTPLGCFLNGIEKNVAMRPATSLFCIRFLTTSKAVVRPIILTVIWVVLASGS